MNNNIKSNKQEEILNNKQKGREVIMNNNMWKYSLFACLAVGMMALSPVWAQPTPDKLGPYAIGFVDAQNPEDIICYSEKGVSRDFRASTFFEYSKTEFATRENGDPLCSKKFERPIVVQIWYPVDDTSTGTPLSEYPSHGNAINWESLITDTPSARPRAPLFLNADVAAGQFPLIVVGPPLRSQGPAGSETDAEILASHGFIVAVPTHTNADMAAAFRSSLDQEEDPRRVTGDSAISPEGRFGFLTRDIQQTIDWMLDDPNARDADSNPGNDRFFGKIDTNAIGGVGYSLGNQTVMGARLGSERWEVDPDPRIKAVSYTNFPWLDVTDDNPTNVELSSLENLPTDFPILNLEGYAFIFESDRAWPLLDTNNKLRIYFGGLRHFGMGSFDLCDFIQRPLEDLIENPPSSSTMSEFRVDLLAGFSDLNHCGQPVKALKEELYAIALDGDNSCSFSGDLYGRLFECRPTPGFDDSDVLSATTTPPFPQPEPYSMPTQYDQGEYTRVRDMLNVSFLTRFLKNDDKFDRFLSRKYYGLHEPLVVNYHTTGVLVPDHTIDLGPGSKIVFDPVVDGSGTPSLYRVSYHTGEDLLTPFGGFLTSSGDTSIRTRAFDEGFPFMGHVFKAVNIAINGDITLGQSISRYRTSSLLGSNIHDANQLATKGFFRIAPYFVDLSLFDSEDGALWLRDDGDKIVITWDSINKDARSGVFDYDPDAEPGPSTFQAVLHSDGKIEFIYGDIAILAEDPDGTIATVGISTGDFAKVATTGRGSLMVIGGMEKPTETHPMNLVDYTSLPEGGTVFKIGTIVEAFTQPVVTPDVPGEGVFDEINRTDHGDGL